jgi:type II secretion system protein N
VKERLTALKERLLRFGPKVGFPIFYLFSFVLFCSWTFPYERVKERIIASYNAGQRAGGSQQELRIDDIGSSFITGVKLRGIRLVNPPADPAKSPSELKIDQASMRISLFGLLVGNKNVSYKIEGLGGSVDGFYNDHGSQRALEVNLDSVDIGQVTPLVDAIGLPLEGSLSGSVTLEMDPEKPSKTNGAIALEVRDLAVGDGKAKIKGTLALPKLNVGTLTLTGEAKDGTLAVKKLSAGGKDLELVGDGRVMMRESAMESGVDLSVRFKINDVYRAKNDVTKSLFGAPGSNAPALFELADMKIKQSKRADGFYAWHVRGQLGRPDFLPAGTSMPSSPFGGPTPPFGAPRSSGP